MRLLIVGGGGFIGSALLKRLAGEHSCVCFGHGSRYAELRESVVGDIKFVEGDLDDEKTVCKLVSEAEAVIHVAGSGGEVPCLAQPTRAVLTHVKGTHLLLREAARNHIERFVYASTIAVYGTYGARPMPLTEEMEARPDDFYGALKATAERELIDAGHYRILRLANIYGYGSGLFTSSSGVIGKFVEAVHDGMPLRVYGDGQQLIDYVHIDDVCDAFERALSVPGENLICNVGGGRPVAVGHIAEVIVRQAKIELDVHPEVTYTPAPPNKIWPDRWLSIEKAKQEMGWQPRTTLEEGIRELLSKSGRRKGN